MEKVIKGQFIDIFTISKKERKNILEKEIQDESTRKALMKCLTSHIRLINQEQEITIPELLIERLLKFKFIEPILLLERDENTYIVKNKFIKGLKFTNENIINLPFHNDNPIFAYMIGNYDYTFFLSIPELHEENLHVEDDQIDKHIIGQLRQYFPYFNREEYIFNKEKDLENLQRIWRNILLLFKIARSFNEQMDIFKIEPIAEIFTKSVEYKPNKIEIALEKEFSKVYSGKLSHYFPSTFFSNIVVSGLFEYYYDLVVYNKNRLDDIRIRNEERELMLKSNLQNIRRKSLENLYRQIYYNKFNIDIFNEKRPIFKLVNDKVKKIILKEADIIQNYYSQMINNKCPHVKLYNSWRSNGSVIGDEIYQELKQYFVDDGTDTIQCNNCSFPIICKHLLENVDRFLSETNVLGAYFCSNCNEKIKEIDEYSVSYSDRMQFQSQDDDIEIYLKKYVNYILKNVDWKVQKTNTGMKKVINKIIDELYPMAEDIYDGLLKFKSDSIESIEAKRKVYINIYIYAYILRMADGNKNIRIIETLTSQAEQDNEIKIEIQDKEQDNYETNNEITTDITPFPEQDVEMQHEVEKNGVIEQVELLPENASNTSSSEPISENASSSEEESSNKTGSAGKVKKKRPSKKDSLSIMISLFMRNFRKETIILKLSDKFIKQLIVNAYNKISKNRFEIDVEDDTIYYINRIIDNSIYRYIHSIININNVLLDKKKIPLTNVKATLNIKDSIFYGTYRHFYTPDFSKWISTIEKIYKKNPKILETPTIGYLQEYANYQRTKHIGEAFEHFIHSLDKQNPEILKDPLYYMINKLWNRHNSRHVPFTNGMLFEFINVSIVKPNFEKINFFNYYMIRCPEKAPAFELSNLRSNSPATSNFSEKARTTVDAHKWIDNVCEYCKVQDKELLNHDEKYYEKYKKQYEQEIDEKTQEENEVLYKRIAQKIVPIENVEEFVEISQEEKDSLINSLISKIRDGAHINSLMKWSDQKLYHALLYLGMSQGVDYQELLNGNVKDFINQNERLKSYLFDIIYVTSIIKNKNKIAVLPEFINDILPEEMTTVTEISFEDIGNKVNYWKIIMDYLIRSNLRDYLLYRLLFKDMQLANPTLADLADFRAFYQKFKELNLGENSIDEFENKSKPNDEDEMESYERNDADAEVSEQIF